MSYNYCPNCGNKDTVSTQDNTKYECSNCNWATWNNPKATIAVICLRQSGGEWEALYSKRGIEPRKGKHDFPGGFLEFGEHPLDACVREIQEETGVELEKDKLVLFDMFNPTYIPGVSVIDIIYLYLEPLKGKPQPSDDSAALKWLPLSFISDTSFIEYYSGLETRLRDYLVK